MNVFERRVEESFSRLPYTYYYVGRDHHRRRVYAREFDGENCGYVALLTAREYAKKKKQAAENLSRHVKVTFWTRPTKPDGKILEIGEIWPVLC